MPVSIDPASKPAGALRDLSLDVLRAVAIFLVMGRHMPEQDPDSSVTGTLLGMWQRGGWIGVDLFFVLSGFLISGLLFAEHQRYGAIQFKRFFIRRGFKIYPAGRNWRSAPSDREFTYDTHLAPTHLRIDSLLFGCLISYFFHFARERFDRFRGGRRGLLAAVGIACLLPPFFWTVETRFIHTPGFTVLFIGSELLLISVIGSRNEWITTSALGWIGRHSYSIYLWHLGARIWLVPAIEMRLGYRRRLPWR